MSTLPLTPALWRDSMAVGTSLRLAIRIAFAEARHHAIANVLHGVRSHVAGAGHVPPVVRMRGQPSTSASPIKRSAI